MFTSLRERHLWTATAAVVACIYATLGLTRPVARFLRANNLLEWTSLIGAVLVGILALAALWRRRPTVPEAATATAIATVYALAYNAIDNPSERAHLIEYGAVAILAHRALLERARSVSVSVPWLRAVALTSIAGFGDEAIQRVMPSRVFDWRDVGFNMLAGVMAIAAVALLRWAHDVQETPTR